MGLFDKFLDVVKTGDNSEIPKSDGRDDNKNENTKDCISHKLIEKAFSGVKKYYEFKIKMANQIADIEPEWNFYDYSIQKRVIEKIRRDIDEISKKINTEMEEMVKLQEKLKNNSDTNYLEIVNKKIASCSKRIRELEDEEYNLKYLLVVELSYFEENIDECIQIVHKTQIKNSFTKLAIPALKAYATKNEEEAIYYTSNYFNSEGEDTDIVYNPILNEIFVKVLIDKKMYQEAVDFLEVMIIHYPESIEYHRIMRKLHIELQDVVGEVIENTILELLE